MRLWLPANALAILAAAIGLAGTALALAGRQRWTHAALCVALAALLLRGYASADRALHQWDERYHALVAKHFIDTPLVPRLFPEPALPYDHREWTGNYIWMHKPPLAMWLQAASMKAFGVHEYALRLPSLVTSTAAVVVTFGIGALLLSPPAGLIAAGFQAFNGFLTDLASGRRVSDHVDNLLIFLFELGLLAGLVAARRGPVASGLALGVACGAAYLTKSLPALLMLPAWAVIRWGRADVKSIAKEIGVAAMTAAAIAAPWNIYAARAFPVESAYERLFAFRRITHVLEGQGGPPWTYLAEMPRCFGELVYLPLGVAIWLAVRTRDAGRRALVLWAAIPYAAFSLCATKAPGYVMTAAPAIFLLQADAWLWLWQRRLTMAPAARFALAALLVVLAILPARQLLEPTGPLEHRERNPVWVQQLRALNAQIGPQRAVVFNIPRNVDAMFYTPYIVYPHNPGQDEVRTLRDRGYQVYVFRSHGTLTVP